MDIHRLADGTPLEIRPIRPDDAARLRTAHQRLSAESRYRRFLVAKPKLSPADARYLTEVDGCDHFALVATVSIEGEEAIVAVARFIRTSDDPEAAEFAIVVGDPYHRQGLAAALIDRLSTAATERGITRFRATMLSDNVAVFRLLEQVTEGELVAERRGEVTNVEVALRPNPPPTHRVLRRPSAIIAPCPGS